MIDTPRVLAVTNMYPTEQDLTSGVFVAEQIESLRTLGVFVEVIHVRRDTEGRAAYRGLPKRVREREEAIQPDLVHVMYGGVMADRVTKTAGVPTVVSFCGSDLNGMPEGPAAERLSAWFGVRASYRAARRSDAVIVKSQQLCETLPSDVNRGKVHVIPNGVDRELFQPLDREVCRRRLGWEAGVCHAMFYARGPGKRPELAREAVALSESRGHAVQFHEMLNVPRQEVPIWMNAADVMICTSVREGSPNTVKEALACGLPVVSVDVGDVAERIQCVGGCHLVAANPPAISDALDRVCQSPQRVDPQAVADLSLEQVAYRVLEGYTNALQRHNA